MRKGPKEAGSLGQNLCGMHGKEPVGNLRRLGEQIGAGGGSQGPVIRWVLREGDLA